jgi:hypothetical protein
MNVPMNQNYSQAMNSNNQNFNNQNNINLIISGKFGNKEIVREDLNTFMSSIKDFEWTDNNIYKSAKSVEIRPTFVVNQSDNNTNSFQSNLASIDQFYLEENNHLRDFQQYKTDCDSRKVQLQDKILQKKKDFLAAFFAYDEKVNEASEKKDLIDAIKMNKVKIIENSHLKEKLEKYIGYMKSQESAAVNYQFDFNSKFIK